MGRSGVLQQVQRLCQFSSERVYVYKVRGLKAVHPTSVTVATPYMVSAVKSPTI